MSKDLKDIIKIYNQLADRAAKNNTNTDEGEVIDANLDGSYNIKYQDQIIMNRRTDDGTGKYPEGTRVLLDIPGGDIDRCVIKGKANFNLPTSPTEKHFSSYSRRSIVET